MNMSHLTPRILTCLALTCPSVNAEINESLGTPDIDDMVFYDDEENTQAEIELGKMLFFDNRLSINQRQSCATCHNPYLGFGDGLPKGVGTKNNPLPRNTPHLYNVAWNSIFMWDGRKPTLEEQALGPIESKEEMMLPLDQMESRINAINGYRTLFQKTYDVQQVTRYEISRAIAAFERTIIVDDTPFDRFIAGDKNALTPQQKRGLKLFTEKAKCIDCHDGPNFTDDSFHSLGLKDNDQGRALISGDLTQTGAFKTPGLRNAEYTAPYMHDGSIKSLEEVIELYDQGGGGAPHTSDLITPLNLTSQEKRDLVAFLKALSQPLLFDAPILPE